ncbi:MAG: hypothetical protein QOG41_1411 [Thermoleophilaceae bacterium]|nr:hypothetical protein [Thermoleophilaceae bacterium]
MRVYPSLRWPLGALLVTLAAIAVSAGPAGSAAPARPQPFPQAQDDGCQRSPVGLVTGESPAWVYVNKDSTPKVVTGRAVNSHVYSNDLSINHQGYDWQIDILPDARYANYVGGDPEKKTGNFAGEAGSSQEKVGSLHTEWENEAIPPFVWPSENDRVKAWGGWVWDCAHWNSDFSDNGAADPGEKTEFHALRGLVTIRKNLFGGRQGQTRADAFISSDGTRAHATAECALSHHPKDGSSYDAGFKKCMQKSKNKHQPVNDMDYKFFVPAPPKPSGNATLVYRLATRVHGSPPQVIKRKSNGIQVTVKFKGFGGPNDALRYGRSFFVGWKDAKPRGKHFRVELGTLTVKHSLDPNPDAANSQQSTPPGEYVMFLEVNGNWFRLNKLLPSLTSVSDGQTFKLKRAANVYLPPKHRLRLYAQGWECDVAGELFPCPTGRAEKALFNDPIGDTVALLKPSKAPGKHTLKSPSGDWKLTYKVVRK